MALQPASRASRATARATRRTTSASRKEAIAAAGGTDKGRARQTGDDRVAGAGRTDLCERGVWGLIAGIAGYERTSE